MFAGTTGTFLFVATHVMQESDPPPAPSPSAAMSIGPSQGSSDHAGDRPDHVAKERNGYPSGSGPVPSGAGGAGGVRVGEGDEGEVGRWAKTVLMVLGMLSPMVLTRIVGHGH